MDRTAAFYSQPSYHLTGGAFPVFSGSRRQKGGSILGSLKSMLLPTLKSVGKSALKTAARSAIGFATDIGNDVMSGKNLKQSIKRRGKQHGRNLAKNIGSQGLNTLSKLTTGRTSHNQRSQKASRKRAAVGKIAQQPAKRRRQTRKALF